MAPLSSLLLSVSILSTVLLAAPVAKQPRVVGMPIARRARPAISKRSAFSVSLSNDVDIGMYYVTASVGNPPQEVEVQLDTGSSDLWVFGPDSCDTSTGDCFGGTYDYTESSTSTLIAADAFHIAYVTPGSGINGSYISDDVTIGGVTISSLEMAAATHAVHAYSGIMGIGFDTDESTSNTYPNIIDDMVSQGLIGSRAYSLWLDDLSASTGQILFGGYDEAKYHGELTTLPLKPDPSTGLLNTFTVEWSSISITGSSSSQTIAVTPAGYSSVAMLDSGTTYTVLPNDIYSQLAAYFKVHDDSTYGNIVSCDIGHGTLDYGFGNDAVIISVPFSEIAVPISGGAAVVRMPDGSAACSFGLSPLVGGSTEHLFGDTFLRSAYVVYDLDRQQVSMAQTKFGSSTGSKVVEI